MKYDRKGGRAVQKLIGSIMIVAAGTGIGFLSGMDLQKYLAEIQCLGQIFLMLKSEITYTKAPLGEAFWNIGNRVPGNYGIWLQELSKRLEKKSGNTFLQLWKETIDVFLKDTRLKKSDLEKLKAMGMHMGYLDEEMQLGTIGLYLEELNEEIKRTREELAMKRRLYNCLGVMGGIFLAVVLI